MIRASGFVLLVPPERASTLLDHAERGEVIGEPVPAFSRSNRAPMLVLASFTPGALTHIAAGRKGIASGTRLVRLNLSDLEELIAPISVRRLLEATPPRLRAPIARRLHHGGLLAPASFQAVVAALRYLAPDLASRLARFGGERDQLIRGLSERAKHALAEQKESIGLALKISGLDTLELLDWNPPTRGTAISFLAGLPGARVREDAMIAHDLSHLPGFSTVRDYPFAAKVFEKDGTRLTVVLANKLPLEEQFGTDLIYYNETYRAFVMVQYKAMERGSTGRAQFRLPNSQLDIEVERMDATLAALATMPVDKSRDGFRLHSGPFFLKLCARNVFNPDDRGLFPGMYLPLDYWRRLVVDPATAGERGGRLITYENVGRRLSESEFVPLVAGGWVGTEVAQSEMLEAVIRDVLEHGKAVTLAVRSTAGKPRRT